MNVIVHAKVLVVAHVLVQYLDLQDLLVLVVYPVQLALKVLKV